MPDPRLNKVLRDLWLNKSRSLLVALSIAVGVCAVGVIFGTRAILTRELQQSYLASQPPSAVLGLPPSGDDLVRALERGPDVRVAEGRRLLTVRVQVSATTWKPLVLQAIPDFTAMRTAIVTRERGAWPPPKRTLSLERASQSLLGASVGDRLTIELPNGDRRTLAISGLAHDVTQPSALFTGQAHGYVTFDTLAALGQPRTYDRLNLIVAHDPLNKAHIQAVVESLKKRLERSGITVYWSDVPNPGEHPANSVLQPLMLLLGVLGGLSLFLSGLLVANMLAALLTQQVKQIGVMKAVGARTGQLAGMYFAAVTLFGLVALAIAAPLGDLGAIAFSRFIAGLLNTDLKSLAIPAGVWAAEGLVALIVPLGAALVPVLRGSRISVREAIQSHGAAGGHPSGAIDRLLQRVRGVSRPLLLSLRNTFRRKGRLALTLITLTLAGAIFVGVLSVNASLHKTLDQALAYWKYDIEVDFAHPERLESI
ncbi:MAG TPA: ABC transporter permease, partial [Limnochordia bacterium]|nr:ABC transporter permease [Limnochordia bacterium]